MAKVKDTGYRMIIENHGGRWMFVNDDIYSFMKCSNCKEQILIKDIEYENGIWKIYANIKN